MEPEALRQEVESSGGWQALIPETIEGKDEAGNALAVPLEYEKDGQKYHLREHDTVKNNKSLGTFVKQAFDNERELGGRIRVPGAEASEEELEKFRSHLRLESADKYEITQPADLPDGLKWSDELVTEAKAVFHKYAIDPRAIPELLAIQTKATVGVIPNMEGVVATFEQTVADLKTEWGAQYEAKAERVGRALSLVFSEEEVEVLNTPITINGKTVILANSPKLMKTIDTLADHIGTDRLTLGGGGGGDAPGSNDPGKELAAIMTDPEHPMHALWEKGKGGDRNALDQVNNHIDGLYKKQYPGVAELG